MNEIDNNGIEVRGKRPTFLKVLCILSFIWMGLVVLSNASSLVTGRSSDAEMKAAKAELAASISDLKKQGANDWIPLIQKAERMGDQMNANHYSISFVNILVALFGIFGVYSMFMGSKLGFHIYIIHCLLSVVSIYLFVSIDNVILFWPLGSLAVSSLFIFMYSRNLKWMR